jgi:DNA-directed RNA polymerase specialized sigma54-like protein
VLRQVLRKLYKKGKIGSSHTHQDNVYRGVADHEKGIAKELVDLLYREGFLMPKPTATDPHVSLNPERVPEVRAIIAGEVANPRLLRHLSEAE